VSQLRCLVCGSSRLDPEKYKCERCGSAVGLRTEECYVNDETKKKLISHADRLSQLGIRIEQVQTLRKAADVGTAVGIIGLVIVLAESFHHGLLKELVAYLRDELLLPEKEILSLRLDEPEEILKLYRNRTVTSAFDSVLPLVKQWKPKPFPRELNYRNSLVGYLLKNLCDARVEQEYRHLGTTVDIYVKNDSNSAVFVELKRNLNSKSEYDRLVGQIESLQPNQNSIIVVLCGHSSQMLVGRLMDKYTPQSGSLECRKFALVLKSHLKKSRSAERFLSKRAKQRQDFRAVLDLHKRRIQATRITNNLYAELRQFREAFLQHGLADKSKINREFFDKWLTDPLVEMGETLAGGWTQARVAELHADLDRLTRKRIAGHKSAYSKLKKKLKDTQEISDMRAEHMKKAGLIVRHPRLR